MSNDGGPAFPSTVRVYDTEQSDAGMSLRDYFAGQVLASVGERCLDNYLSESHDDTLSVAAMASETEPEHIVADLAYILADAMIAARNKTTDTSPQGG